MSFDQSKKYVFVGAVAHNGKMYSMGSLCPKEISKNLFEKGLVMPHGGSIEPRLDEKPMKMFGSPVDESEKE